MQLSGYIQRWFTRPHTVTHPSSNPARRRLTTGILIETSMLLHFYWCQLALC